MRDTKHSWELWFYIYVCLASRGRRRLDRTTSTATAYHGHGPWPKSPSPTQQHATQPTFTLALHATITIGPHNLNLCFACSLALTIMSTKGWLAWNTLALPSVGHHLPTSSPHTTKSIQATTYHRHLVYSVLSDSLCLYSYGGVGDGGDKGSGAAPTTWILISTRVVLVLATTMDKVLALSLKLRERDNRLASMLGNWQQKMVTRGKPSNHNDLLASI